MRVLAHALTPGDHYSPRTGSAIPTVVHGIAEASSGDPRWRHAVVVDRTTFHPRYAAGSVWECEPSSPPSRAGALLDYCRAALGGRRLAEDAWWDGVARRAARGAPAIVLAHGNPSLAAHPALVDTPVIVHLHNALPRSMSRTEAERAVSPAAAIICVSQSLASATASRLPKALRSRIHAVAHGVDTGAFHPRDGEVGSTVRIMFIGRAVPHKGVHVLLAAAQALTGLPAELVIVGSHGFSANDPVTRYQRRLARLARQSPIPVEFMPFVDRSALPDLLRTADVLVVPSTWSEPSGLAAGEGLATGIPVVASHTGGLPEVVGDAGILVPPADAEPLAAALRTLVADAAMRAELGAAARKRALAHTWAHSWTDLRAVIDSC
ncbi:MAG: glycosyltransferase family 4 protein [Demequina sp.]